MGRTKEFHDDQALEKAMKLFWEKGYEHSSLKDLLAAMDILNGSFYHTYGNKKNLFIKSLELYYKDLSEKRSALFALPGNFKKKIRVIFQYSLDRQESKDCPKGCFLVNCLSPDVLENADIREFVLSCIYDFEAYLAHQIKLAIASGELDDSLDPGKTAAVINIYLQGLLKLCVLDFSKAKLLEQTEYFLTALGI